MTNYGMVSFDYPEYTSMALKLQNRKEIPQNSIKYKILNMLKGLLYTYRENVIESFIELWISESKITKYPPVPNVAINRRKIIEMMLSLDIHVT